MRLGLPRLFVAEIYAILEVLRRFLWAILRFEWEHVNNGVMIGVLFWENKLMKSFRVESYAI
jgi:hypothetical protein